MKADGKQRLFTAFSRLFDYQIDLCNKFYAASYRPEGRM